MDGTSGPCGGIQPLFTDNESPGGVVDGANLAFTLAAAPNPSSSLVVFRNGIRQKPGQDYSSAANTIQFIPANAPQPGDTLLVSYRLAGAGIDASQLYPGPQVLCSGMGAGTVSATLASVGNCGIPGGFLAAGDRLEIRFDLEHQGTAGGYSFEVHWGATTLLHRDAAAGDTFATGRADVALKATGAQLSYQSWGATLALSAGAGAADDDYFSNGIAIDFQARVAAGDTVTLRSFTVVRIP